MVECLRFEFSASQFEWLRMSILLSTLSFCVLEIDCRRQWPVSSWLQQTIYRKHQELDRWLRCQLWNSEVNWDDGRWTRQNGKSVDRADSFNQRKMCDEIEWTVAVPSRIRCNAIQKHRREKITRYSNSLCMCVSVSLSRIHTCTATRTLALVHQIYFMCQNVFIVCQQIVGTTYEIRR